MLMMNVDWGYAGLVGGVGFGMVFLLLIILAILIWGSGYFLSRKRASIKKLTEKEGD